MPHLFDPFTLKNVSLRNRIVASPMCMYSAPDGVLTEWHYAHLGQLAAGGAGLVTVEMTAVSPEGRLTWGDSGLWNDEQMEALRPAVVAIKADGAVPGIQLGHAGRKASANRPWEGDNQIADDAPNGWPIIAPSPIAFGGDNLWKTPREMAIDDIRRVQSDFAQAARRALDAGFQYLELHFGHGMLAQSFFSTYSNHRRDEYGGSYDSRARFLLETVAAVRDVWPEEFPLSVRFGVIEYDGRDEETLTESTALVKQMKAAGVDILSVSMGFSTMTAQIPWGPGFMAPIAERVRREADLPVAIAWGMGTPKLADDAVRNGQGDIVKIGRALLANPHWPYVAAAALGVERPSWATLPPPYAYWLERCQPETGVAPV